MKKLTLTLAVLTLLNGCSVFKALSQPGPADLEGVGVGTLRQSLISKIGAPKLTDTAVNGDKQDMFEFESGFHQASKIRVIPYIAADLFTLFLAEVVLWPLELTALDSATCTGIATYDDKFKIRTWNVSDKDDSAQDC